MATKGTKTIGERFRRIRHSAVGQAKEAGRTNQAGRNLTGTAGANAVVQDPHAPLEHFIPVRREDLLQALTADLTTTDADREQLQHICQLLEDSFHFLHYRRYRTLLSDYSPFDPDADTPPLAMDNEAERTRRATALCDKLASLLRQANFRRLERDDIALALEAASDWGLRLKVRFEDFEQLEVYARGEGVLERERRTWRTLFRPRPVEVPVFQRLAIVFRRKVGTEPEAGALEPDEGAVHIKLFKNIPKYDIEMLLPGVQVKMSWLDRGRILLPTISGLALTGYKLIKGALVIAAVSLYGILALLGLIGGTLGYGVKSLMGYLRTKDKYHLQLTRNLYYRNLDNNAGALFRLVAEAEEQELREVLLSYFLLWRDAGVEGWTSRQLDEACEEFLTRLLGTDVDFEVGDAIRKLEHLRLVDPRPGHRWRAISLDEAYRRLREKWQAYRTAET
ncbi:MAG: TMEM143 family protein [Pirellulales bacterium]